MAAPKRLPPELAPPCENSSWLSDCRMEVQNTKQGSKAKHNHHYGVSHTNPALFGAPNRLPPPELAPADWSILQRWRMKMLQTPHLRLQNQKYFRHHWMTIHLVVKFDELEHEQFQNHKFTESFFSMPPPPKSPPLLAAPAGMWS